MVVMSVVLLFLILQVPEKNLLREIYHIIKLYLNGLPLRRVRLFLAILGLAVIGLGWGAYRLLFRPEALLIGAKIAVLLILLWIGLILVLSQGYAYCLLRFQAKWASKRFYRFVQRRAGRLADVFFGVVIVLFVVPSDLSQVVHNFFPDAHIFAYMFAPALYHAENCLYVCVHAAS